MKPPKISISTIKNANNLLIKKGVSSSTNNFTHGEITIAFTHGNLNYSKKITKEEIKSAYQQSIHDYAEKL